MAKLNTNNSSCCNCTPFLLLFLLFFFTSFSFSESISLPLNLETYYPYTLPAPAPPVVSPATDYSPAITPPPPSPTRSRAYTKKLATAVAATAVTTFAAVGLLFLFWLKFGRREHKQSLPAAVVTPAGSRSEFTRLGGRVKGVIVDEDGLDVIYWRSLKSSTGRSRSLSYADIHAGDGVGAAGQTQPPPLVPLPPEKKMIPAIPPPPHFPPTKTTPPPPPPRQGSGSSSSAIPEIQKLPSGGSKTLEAVANQEPHNSMAKESFQYNGDMMEALFGLMATNRKATIEDDPKHNAEIFILDEQKSRDAAVVLESFGVPPGKVIESLNKGKGLSIGELEKLARIAPTRTEESEIMAFDGDSTRLADAELFLYSLLKAVPSAFKRANAMLFRFRYDAEIGIIQETLRTIESACSEIRSCGVFLKLLESILNAGSQLNGGTATNAKVFSLGKLLKLSDYKSSDGSTTLLNFVVHKVVRNEGRRCVLARNNSTIRSYDKSPATQSNDPVAKVEKEREFLKLGLPVVGGLGSDLSNVKKAACLDYEALLSSLASLKARVDETQQLVAQCRSSGGGGGDGGGFVKEMGGFLESAEADIKAIQEKQTGVMDAVMRATQDYQAADSSDSNPLHLFVMVKDFLAMVDQACIEITRSLQQKKPATAVSGPGSSQPDVLRGRVNFPRLPDNFLSDKN